MRAYPNNLSRWSFEQGQTNSFDQFITIINYLGRSFCSFTQRCIALGFLRYSRSIQIRFDALGLFSADYPSSASELADTTNPVVFGWIRNEWAGKYPINLIWADYYNRHGLVDLAKSLNGIKVTLKKSPIDNETKWKSWKEPSKKELF